MDTATDMGTAPTAAANAHGTPMRARRTRRSGRIYEVRDATGMLRHSGRSKQDALAPYKGLVLRAQRQRRDNKVMTVKRQTLWRYLVRRGWTCEIGTR